MHQLRRVNIFIKNKIFSYSMDETWENILKNLLEDFIFILTSSLHGMDAFHPNMTEQIWRETCKHNSNSIHSH